MRNTVELTDKVALVTGASSGIGYATAIALAEQGAAVAINYHKNEAGAQSAQQQIREAGGRAIVVQADVTKSSEVSALIERTTNEFGAIDILINNAGSLIERLKILDLTEERWDQVMDLNLKSAFLCSKAVVATMMERRSGTIINVSSIAGRNGGALGSIHYSAAKGGLIAFTKGLAKELAPYGVRVNSVSPGVIATPFHEQFSTAEAIKAAVSNIPLGRVGSAAEVGQVIAFLASDGASYLVGESIEINGGMLML
jgi:3-oxoacyl-[acyl-carrier protein] reductase